jgi:amino acid adenylation domain-containing protein
MADDVTGPGSVPEPPAGSRERAAAIQARLADRRSRLSTEGKTLLAQRLRRRDGTAGGAPDIPRRAAPGPSPLSLAQERLWFLEQMDPQGAVFNMPCALRCRGRFAPAALRASVRELMRRHEILRATFGVIDDGPVLDVGSVGPVAGSEVPCVDLSGLAAPERESELARRVAAEASRPFDLQRDPPLRTCLLRLGEDEHVILAVMHHLVSDAWSLGILARELMTLYEAFAAGRPSPLPELPIQYPDFAVWQRQWLQGDVLASLVTYWRERLAGLEPLALPTDRPRPAVRRFAGGQLFLDLGLPLSEDLRRLVRAEDTTLFITLLAAFQALLHRVSGQNDVTVGAFTAGRTRLEVEGLIGFFVNNLVLRTDLAGRPSFKAALRRVAETAAGAFSHQDLPFEKLLRELVPERLLSSTPLFQVLFHLDEDGAARELRLPELEVSFLPLPESFGRFDLTLVARDRASGLRIGFEYDRELFDATTVARLAEHFRNLLRAAVTRPEESIAALPLLTPPESHQLILEWNDTLWRPVHPEVVSVWFERQAAVTPDAVAVVLGEERGREQDGESLTYRELDRAANRLARHLRRQGIGPDSAVGIHVERSLDLAVGVLGILKAGAAYVPLDPSYPLDRLAYMLEDAGVRVLVTQEPLAGMLPVADRRLVLLDRDRASLEAESAEPLAGTLHPDLLAYVIYTSGSTGRPKGIGLSHRALTNLLEWHLPLLLGGVRTLQFAALSFDASFHEMFAAWYTGGTLVIVPEALRRDRAGLLDFLVRERIEKAIFPVVVLHQLAEEILARGWKREALPLREITTTGEQLQVNHAVVDLFRRLPDVPLHNHYGPSESHVVTAHTLRGEPGDWPGSPSIGRPVFNSRIHLLDPLDRPVPVGVAGELFIGGVCLFRGYVNRPDLTAEKLVPDPLAAEPGARLYRTGDLARRRADGTIDFLGRMDHQLKIRGFRVEPGEIETLLGRHPAVREVAVVAREVRPGDRQLVAYVVLEPHAEPGGLRSWLAECLPEYMVPAFVVPLEAMPLTPSGKVDRRALPAPDRGAGEGEDLSPPTDAVEELLAGVWAEVLGLERVGVHSDFFSLGGHSLLATRVMSRLRGLLAVDLPLRRLFETPTVAGLARTVRLAREEGEETAPALVPVPRDGAPPLSFAQQRLWVIDQLDPGSAAYNIPGAVRLSGAPAVEMLARIFAEIVRRHESLRTTFDAHGGQPVQRIAPELRPDLPVIDLSGIPPAAREREARELAREDARRPFDLRRGPLLRLGLVRLEEREHLLLVSLHHIVSDDWSLGVLLREIAALHEAWSQGRPSPLPELPVQYADFAVWQRGWLQGEALARQLSYWTGQLSGAPDVLELPADRPRPAVRSFRGAACPVILPAALAAGVREVCRTQGVTPFMALWAAWAAVLGRHAGQEDLLVGVPIAGRNRREIEGLIGFFVNTLVLRADLSGEPGFAELLGRVRGVALDAYTHQDLPFERLVEALVPERDLARSPLFQVLFALQNAFGEPGEIPGLAMRPLVLDEVAAKFDLSLTLSETPEGFAGFLEHSLDLFDGGTAALLASRFATLLAAAVAEPGRAVGDLALFAPGELDQVLWERNDTRRSYPREASLSTLFAAVVDASPDAVAVVEADGEAWSYRRLNEASIRLAGSLEELGVGPGSRVGVAMERSAGLLTALLAILRQGAAYVPLDPAYPDDRLTFLRENAGLSLVLVHAATRQRFAAVRQVCLDRDREAIAARLVVRPAVPVPAEALAYLIYTSGSTGRPKGVAVPHRAVARLVWGADDLALRPGDRLAFNANTSFDAATWEIWGTLLRGAALVVIPQEILLSPTALAERLERERVTVLHLTTPLFNRMVREAPEALAPLRLVLFGGEASDPAAAALALRRPPGRLLHTYGPTESTTFAAWHPVREVAPGAATVPIGSPLGNTTLYVVDRVLAPLPPGVAGELAIGGDGLAQGYWNRPELTAGRFVPHPWAAGERLYLTGDLVRWRTAGPLEFLGRLDGQVKIRGVRIEPGEIEAALAAHPEVRECVVLARPDSAGDRRLVAWAVLRPGSGLENPVTALRAHLLERLPDPLIPSAIVILEGLPLTAHGKVDRKALPDPEPVRAAGATWSAPTDPVEELLAGLWERLLAVDRVGLHDDFFALGGHSLLATQVVSRIREVLGVELPLRALFEAPTVAGLSRTVREARESMDGSAVPAAPLIPVPRQGGLPLSFAQQRLWLIDQMVPDSPMYNMSSAVRLTGDLGADLLARIFTEIVRRHEPLRTTFEAHHDGPVQVIHPAPELALPLADLSGLPEAEREGWVRRMALDEARRPFDLRSGPLLRLFLLRLKEREHVLLMTLHHIVSDGWSMGVLQREIAVLYEAFSQGLSSPLPELPVQYADFAVWQRGWLQGEELERQLAFWRRGLQGAPRVLELPTDRPRPPVQSFAGASRAAALPPALSVALRELGRRDGVTSFMILLAAWAALLGRHAGQEDVLVGTPAAGRNRREVEDLIGFFINTLALRVDLSGAPSFTKLLRRVRESALGSFAHQDLPFERLVEEMVPQRDLGASPLFQVLFALQNAPGRGLSVPGLTLAPIPVDDGLVKFDLALSLWEEEELFSGFLEHNAGLFDGSTAERFLVRFEALLEGAVAEPGRPLPELPAWRPAERQQALVEWNDTRHDFPRETCLPGLFEAVARELPDAPAVIAEGEVWSYRQVDEAANRLARRLRRLGTGVGTPVGISMERSPGLILGILAILKAGGVYVPLDPGHPDERLALLLAETGIRVVLVQPPGRERLASLPGGAELLVVEEEWAVEEGSPLGVRVPAESLAYVIYTSGSTGQPKGVAVPHRAVARLVWGPEDLTLLPGDRFAFTANPSFDAATYEIWATLLRGAALVVISQEILLSPAALAERLEREKATVLHLTTALFNRVVREVPHALAPLRTLLFGGEASDPAAVALALRQSPERLLHMYGPTECTTFSSWRAVRELAPEAVTVPIGRPIGNTGLYVLDREHRPVPPGVAGELCVGGDGLARGYLNRPELTAERFVPHPWEAGERLYRTGDLVRQLRDGSIEFLRRLDHQIKIRGFRIEPGEIEAVLGRLPGVRQSVVLAISSPGEERDAYLAAYVVPDIVPDGKPDSAALKAGLREVLPPYMVPSAFVFLKEIPVTAVGKVDRRALPVPDRGRTEGETVAPRTPQEEALAGIWQEILGVAQVSVVDDFFALGGHSLLATRMISRIRQELGLDVPVRLLFEHPTIESLAQALGALRWLTEQNGIAVEEDREELEL